MVNSSHDFISLLIVVGAQVILMTADFLTR